MGVSRLLLLHRGEVSGCFRASLWPAQRSYSSMHAVAEQVRDLFPPATRDAFTASLVVFALEVDNIGSQRAWMNKVYNATSKALLDGCADIQDGAWLSAVARSGAVTVVGTTHDSRLTKP